MNSVIFLVEGEPVPKQSTRFDGHGRAHTHPRVKAWQERVASAARQAMQGHPPFTGPVSMRIVFNLGNHRRVDLDNLNKGLSDAINGIVWVDDSQVVSLHLVKGVRPIPGALVEVYAGETIPFSQ